MTSPTPKRMKNKGNILNVIVLLVLFISCSKEEEPLTPNIDLLPGIWQLTEIVNISDEDKYLNTVLELKETYKYSNTEPSGELITSGKWEYLNEQETLELSSGIFIAFATAYQIKTINSETLILEEHYTLGGKDAYLEYHYTRVR